MRGGLRPFDVHAARCPARINAAPHDQHKQPPTLKVWFLAVWFFSLTILLVCLKAWLL